MPDGVPDLGAAFLGSSYGRADERLWLYVDGPGVLPGWSAPGGRWGIVTAWNPGGAQAGSAENDTAQTRLTGRVQGWSPLSGFNGDGGWREDTLILRGVPLREAARLGRQFGQAAILWGVGRRAALVWLDGPPSSEGLRIERLWLRRAASPGTADCGYTAGL